MYVLYAQYYDLKNSSSRLWLLFFLFQNTISSSEEPSLLLIPKELQETMH